MPTFVNLDQAVTHARKMARLLDSPQFVIDWQLPRRAVTNARPTDKRVQVIQIDTDGGSS